MIKVLLADDQALVRAGFHSLLGRSEDIEVVGEAGTGTEAVALVPHRSMTRTCSVGFPRESRIWRASIKAISRFMCHLLPFPLPPDQGTRHRATYRKKPAKRRGVRTDSHRDGQAVGVISPVGRFRGTPSPSKEE